MNHANITTTWTQQGDVNASTFGDGGLATQAELPAGVVRAETSATFSPTEQPELVELAANDMSVSINVRRR